VVQELVERGASLTIHEGMYGGTPVDWAAGPAVRQYLLDRTTDVFDLAYYGRADRLAELLDDDPSLVQSRRPSGKTLLHVLQDATSFEAILDLLLERGADLNALDGEGRTPLDVATDEGAADVATALRIRGARRSFKHALAPE
jgi:uncharacterized protein